eukprot:TRINITY_DN3054_c0_g1_i19.p1 TRINITY_DN3054_c0_g1~~TRINITY_DN3054_c0_g1_i19.p1  ORF type:complete len:282 (+),score=9.31 TRINITY_DN3054_c0_g1_i19:320-1165(+)
MQCDAALDQKHPFYTGAPCTRDQCVCGTRCVKCFLKGHKPSTIALDPRLFKRNITAGGMSHTKKQHIKLACHFYLCKESGQPYFEAAAQRSRDRCASKDTQAENTERRRQGLVANLARASTPRSDALQTLQAVGSTAATVAPANLAASHEQARCADAGLRAVASAWAGAVADATGQPSGVVSDDAPIEALALLSGKQAEAQGAAAKRMRDAALALDSPQGSTRLYVLLGSVLFVVPHFLHVCASLFEAARPTFIWLRILLSCASPLGGIFLFMPCSCHLLH